MKIIKSHEVANTPVNDRWNPVKLMLAGCTNLRWIHLLHSKIQD